MTRCLIVFGVVLACSVAVANAVEDKDALDSAYKRGEDLKAAGRYAEAAAEYEKVVALAPKVFGNEDVKTAGLVFNLAFLYNALGQYSKAEPLYLRSLEIRETKFGKDHLGVGDCLNGLAGVYYSMGKYLQAEPLFLRSLRIRESTLGRDHPGVADCLNNLALVYNAMGRHSQAVPLLERCLEIRETKLGKDHLAVADALDGLVGAYRDMNRLVKAQAMAQRCLEIREARFGKDNLAVAEALNSLAVIYDMMGQYSKAEPLQQRCIDIRKARLGENHPSVANGLGNLALLYSSMNLDSKAEPLYLQSLQILEANFGKDHPYVAFRLNGLAGLYAHMGLYSKAAALYERSLRILEEKLENDPVLLAPTLSNLGTLYCSRGQYVKAKPLLTRALQIWESKLGERDPFVAHGLAGLAILNAGLGQYAEAAVNMTRSRQIRQRHLAVVLATLPDQDQIAYLEQYRSSMDTACSLGLADAANLASAESSAEWVLNAKASTVEILAERSRLAIASTDPSVRTVASELQLVRADLATAYVRPPPDRDYDARRKRIEELAERESGLSKKLGQVFGGTVRKDAWVGLEEIRKSIPANAALVELVRFSVFRFEAKEEGETEWKPARYAAWIIPSQGKGNVLLIDLGPAEPIDAAVGGFRAAILASRSNPQSSKASDAEVEALTGADALAKLVWRPIENALGKTESLIISPDGDLWLVPWEVLPDKNGKYLIESKHVSYLNTGRDLVAGKSQTQAKGSLVFADPDFDLGVSQAMAESRRILKDQQLTMADERGRLERSSGLTTAKWERLAGTAAEAEAISPKLKAYVQAEPSVYTDKQALEGVFKACRSPKVLVMSTHGFFLEDQYYANAAMPASERDRGTFLTEARRPRSTSQPVRLETPLLRCGLVLAGANNRQGVETGEDGILTGLEIVGTDLRGTDLVVLSACETGVGKVQNGEGVAGLRQAFQLAGAKTVVSTLWRIPDQETTELMTMFFDNLAKGQGKAEALRNAQLAMIARLRKDVGAAHPYYWAAFTLTGDWR